MVSVEWFRVMKVVVRMKVSRCVNLAKPLHVGHYAQQLAHLVSAIAPLREYLFCGQPSVSNIVNTNHAQ